MAIDTTDVRTHGDVQIIRAADFLSSSDDKQLVFEEIYRGKSNGKTAKEIAENLISLNKRPDISSKRVLEIAHALSASKLIRPNKAKGELTIFLKDSFFSLHKTKVLYLARNKNAREKFRAKVYGVSARVVIRASAHKPQRVINVAHLTIDEIDSFQKVKNLPLAVAEPQVPILEETFQQGLQRILGEAGIFKDWGGEGDDLFSTRILLNGKRMATAFALKGRGTKGKLTPKKLGENGDQIQRLFKSPAEVFIIQYWGQIAESVSEQMKELATAKSAREQKKVYYALIDGQDTMRIIKAYPECFSQKTD